jgi:hypothetical protein
MKHRLILEDIKSTSKLIILAEVQGAELQEVNYIGNIK